MFRSNCYQGMHELLGLLFWQLDLDSLPQDPGSSEPLMHSVLSRTHVPHDAYVLFCALMKSAKDFYDPTPSVYIPAKAGQQQAVQPITARCKSIHDRILRQIDEELWQRFEELEIEPQLWGL
jgi:TBC1 domain family protein 5